MVALCVMEAFNFVQSPNNKKRRDFRDSEVQKFSRKWTVKIDRTWISLIVDSNGKK